MSGTYSASQDGESFWITPGVASTSAASGTPRAFSSASASAAITTTIRGCTIASSSSTHARQSGADRSVFSTGHLTKTVP